MDIFEGANRQRARAVALHVYVVKLLDGDGVALHSRDPRDMPRLPGIGLRNAPWHRLVVDFDADLASGLVPGVGIAPRGSLVLVHEVDVEAIVDAPRDETSALARVVVPAVDVAAGAGPVWVVVLDGAVAGGAAAGWGRRGGDRVGVALGLDVLARAGLYVVVGDVAAVGGEIPDSVAADASAGGLAGDGHGVALGVGLLDGVVCARTGAAVDDAPSDGVGAVRGVAWGGDVGGRDVGGRDLGGRDFGGRGIRRRDIRGGDVRGSNLGGRDICGGGDRAVGGDAGDDRDIDSAAG